MAYAISIRGIDKSFGKIHANNNIDLDVEKGHIHVLLGENGSGKTTLMRTLYGEEKPDSGKISIDGENNVQISSPADAICRGIGFIHQHFMLVDDYSVVENFALGLEKKKALFFVDYTETRKKAIEIFKELNISIDINKKVDKFSIEEQQVIEIGKALYRGANILILDEPTSVLSPQKISNLLKLLVSLKENGKTIIFITHKLEEALSIADEITILRKGKNVGTFKRSDVDKDFLIEKLIGGGKIAPLEKGNKKIGPLCLQVEDLVVSSYRKVCVKDVSFDVHYGEVVCITGVGGNGQKELIEAITGMRKQDSGKVIFNEKDISKLSIRQRRKSGMSYIPENRIRTGSAVDLSISDNLLMGHYIHPTLRKGIYLPPKKIKWFSNTIFDEFGIVGDSINSKASSLSGGNLQKVIIAREFSFESKLLIISYPSHGIDIKATRFVHQEILRRKNSGCAILLLTGDLDEAFALSDRIGVFFNGNLVTMKNIKKASHIEIGKYMTGVKTDIQKEKMQ